MNLYSGQFYHPAKKIKGSLLRKKSRMDIKEQLADCAIDFYLCEFHSGNANEPKSWCEIISSMRKPE